MRKYNILKSYKKILMMVETNNVQLYNLGKHLRNDNFLNVYSGIYWNLLGQISTQIIAMILDSSRSKYFTTEFLNILFEWYQYKFTFK